MTHPNNQSQELDVQWIETESTTVRYNPATKTYRTVCDWSDNSPTTTVLEALEAIQDIEMTELPPLFERVDPEALDQLFESGSKSENHRRAGRVTFPYAGFLVTIHADGEISLSPLSNNERNRSTEP